jgi:hypothetical protein
MRALVLAAVVAAAGCHDFDHFRSVPDGGGGAADLALPGGDLAGCPMRSAPPAAGVGCVLYTFTNGVPGELTTVVAKSDATVDTDCGMLHVRLPAGTSHDLWIDDLGGVRVEEKVARAGAFTMTARVRGALDQIQKFSGLYATDGAGRFVSIQTSADASGLHDHDVVFSYGAGSAEQANYPNAVPAAGDSYPYELSRLTDTTKFQLVGSQSQTLTVTAPPALTPGVVVGNCCGATAPAFDAWVEWLMICQ